MSAFMYHVISYWTHKNWKGELSEQHLFIIKCPLVATEIKNKAERLALQLSAHELDVSPYVLLIWHGILL